MSHDVTEKLFTPNPNQRLQNSVIYIFLQERSIKLTTIT